MCFFRAASHNGNKQILFKDHEDFIAKSFNKIRIIHIKRNLFIKASETQYLFFFKLSIYIQLYGNL